MSIDVVENVYMDLFERANHLEENGEETIVDIALKNEQLSEGKVAQANVKNYKNKLTNEKTRSVCESISIDPSQIKEGYGTMAYFAHEIGHVLDTLNGIFHTSTL